MWLVKFIIVYMVLFLMSTYFTCVFVKLPLPPLILCRAPSLNVTEFKLLMQCSKMLPILLKIQFHAVFEREVEESSSMSRRLSKWPRDSPTTIKRCIVPEMFSSHYNAFFAKTTGVCRFGHTVKHLQACSQRNVSHGAGWERRTQDDCYDLRCVSFLPCPSFQSCHRRKELWC